MHIFWSLNDLLVCCFLFNPKPWDFLLNFDGRRLWLGGCWCYIFYQCDYTRWVVVDKQVFSPSFSLTFFCLPGVIASSGILLNVLLDQFKEGKAVTGWIPSLLGGLLLAVGKIWWACCGWFSCSPHESISQSINHSFDCTAVCSMLTPFHVISQLIYPSIDWLIGFFDQSIDWLIDWSIDWLIFWSIHWLIFWLIDWLIDFPSINHIGLCFCYRTIFKLFDQPFELPNSQCSWRIHCCKYIYPLTIIELTARIFEFFKKIPCLGDRMPSQFSGD